MEVPKRGRRAPRSQGKGRWKKRSLRLQTTLTSRPFMRWKKSRRVVQMGYERKSTALSLFTTFRTSSPHPRPGTHTQSATHTDARRSVP